MRPWTVLIPQLKGPVLVAARRKLCSGEAQPLRVMASTAPQSDNENGIPPGFPSYRFLRLEHFFNSVIDPASAGLDPSKAVTKC